MRTYRAFFSHESDPVLVKLGFSKRVLILGPLGLLSLGAWISGLLLAAVDMAALVFCPAGYTSIAIGSLNIACAVFTPEIRCWELSLSGHTSLEEDNVIAANHDQALLRVLDRQITVNTPPELPCVLS
ncbi:hypothetical protein D5366_10285 [Neokomagataea tanensis]|uniref:DUF2628 domain-containing protein n=1 Tax=Neokomagataea tanensis TaxID=661191 RepID=A0A4Y6VAY7_9PROT|nr:MULTISPECIES: hypothetical protein [Neokomagataea]QDH25535.1 hypothetical protein D5366_10285 [Neokomagataea tanensis]